MLALIGKIIYFLFALIGASVSTFVFYVFISDYLQYNSEDFIDK